LVERDDLVARIAVCLLCESDRGLGAWKDDHSIGRNANPACFAHRVRDRFAEGKDALRVIVMGGIVVYLPLHFLCDVAGKGKVRLSEVASNYVISSVLNFLDEWTDLECVLRVEHCDSVGIERSRCARGCGGGCHRVHPW